MKKHLLAWILLSLSFTATAMDGYPLTNPTPIMVRGNDTLYTTLVKHYSLHLSPKALCQCLNDEDVDLPGFKDKVYFPRDIIRDIIFNHTPLQIIDLWRHIINTYPKTEKGQALVKSIRKSWNHPDSLNVDLLLHADFTVDQIMEGPFINLVVDACNHSAIKQIIPLVAQNTTLSSLDISAQKNKNLTLEELKALGESLKSNKTLTSIGLDLKNIPSRPDFPFYDVFAIHTTFRKITLKYGVINDAVLQKITDNIAFNTNLTSLDISQSNISNSALIYLLDGLSKNPILNYLNIAYKYHARFHDKALSSQAMEKIGSLLENHPNLEDLDLSHYKLADGGIKYITKGMVASNSLKTLKLVGCNLYNDDLKILTDALILNPCLTSLFLGFNNITHESVDFLANVFKFNTHLTTLDLADPPGCASLFHINNGGGNGASTLFKSLENNTTLTALNLGKVAGEMCISSLISILKATRCLTMVSLSHCTFQMEEATQLGDVLKTHSTLKNLSLKNLSYVDRKISIGHHIIAPIAKSLWYNTTMRELDFGKSSIGNEGAYYLSRLLSHNQSITSLDISGDYCVENSITAEGFKHLAGALKGNRSLTKLNLSRNKLCSEILPNLADLFKTNSTLEVLNLYKNKFQNFNKYRDLFIEGLQQNKALLQINMSQCDLRDQDREKLLKEFPGRIIL